MPLFVLGKNVRIHVVDESDEEKVPPLKRRATEGGNSRFLAALGMTATEKESRRAGMEARPYTQTARNAKSSGGGGGHEVGEEEFEDGSLVGDAGLEAAIGLVKSDEAVEELAAGDFAGLRERHGGGGNAHA